MTYTSKIGGRSPNNFAANANLSWAFASPDEYRFANFNTPGFDTTGVSPQQIPANETSIRAGNCAQIFQTLDADE